MKVGVIGHLGSIGRTHARSLRELGHDVIGHDSAEEATTLDEVWKADAVVIASPTPMHVEHLGMALCRNIPTFVEKPIAHATLDEDDAGLSQILACMVKMVGYNLRFHSCVVQAKEWIDAGFLGHPQWANLVCAQFNGRPDYRRDGVILNWSHEIDLALYLLGPAKISSCVTDQHEQLADIVLQHDIGCHSTVHLDYLTSPEIRQTIIVGTKATIIIDLVSRNAWLRSTRGQVLDHFQGYDTWEDNYKDEIETFIARVQGKETVGCTGLEGLATLRVCLEARRLARMRQ